MSSCTHRSVLTDSNGKLWDLANPNFIAVSTSDAGVTTDILMANGSTQPSVPISFSTASAAFSAS